MFSFLSNVGATLCFGSNANRHIGIHALNFDSCKDATICNFSESRTSFSDYKNKSDYSNFQINLNKILLWNFNAALQTIACTDVSYTFDLFEEKYNKINWNIYDNYNIKNPLRKLKTTILII